MDRRTVVAIRLFREDRNDGREALSICPPVHLSILLPYRPRARLVQRLCGPAFVRIAEDLVAVIPAVFDEYLGDGPSGDDAAGHVDARHVGLQRVRVDAGPSIICLLYTSDAADERSSVD